MPSRERMRAAMKRAMALTSRGVDLFPVTLPGLLTLGGAALSFLYYGMKRLDLLLLVIGVVGFALGALALLFTLVAAMLLGLRLRKLASSEPLRLECGVPALTGVTIPRLWFMPMVKVAWSWVEPEATVRPRATGVPLLRGLQSLQEEIIPRRRCLTDRILRRVEVGDAFGLTRVAFRVREARPLQVIPSVGALKSVHLVRSIASGEDLCDPAGSPAGERVDTRAYAEGDPLRLILWKVFARTRELVVRTPERAYSVSRKMIVYTVAGEGDEPVAGAARVAVESGALGETWVLGADGDPASATNPTAALELLSRSAACPPAERGRGLGPFLKRVGEGAHHRAVVFVPPASGPWIEPVLAAVRARGALGSGASAKVSPVEFVVCTDGIARDGPRSILARLAFASRRAPILPQAKASEIAAVVRALSSVRARVVILDRLSGKLHEGGPGFLLGQRGEESIAAASFAAPGRRGASMAARASGVEGS